MPTNDRKATCRCSLLVALLTIHSLCTGCWHNGTRLTQQQLRLRVLSIETGRPVPGAQVVAMALSGWPDQPRPITQDDREFFRVVAGEVPGLTGKNMGSAAMDGLAVINVQTSSSPGYFSGMIGQKIYNVTGKNWGFRVDADGKRDYCAIFPMKPGAHAAGDHFRVEIEDIGQPVEPKRK